MRLFLFDGFVLYEDAQHVPLPPQAQRLIAFVALRRTVDVTKCSVHCGQTYRTIAPVRGYGQRCGGCEGRAGAY